MHWDDGITGTTDVNKKDLFGDYQSITKNNFATAKATRTNDRAIHNAHAIYKALHTSLTADIKNQIFS